MTSDCLIKREKYDKLQQRWLHNEYIDLYTVNQCLSLSCKSCYVLVYNRQSRKSKKYGGDNHLYKTKSDVFLYPSTFDKDEDIQSDFVDRNTLFFSM